MDTRKLHKVIGLILLLPLFGWAITGIVFLVKPGYEGAYEKLVPKTYPMEKEILINAEDSWSEIRLFRTTLGHHLIIKKKSEWLHLDPFDLQAKARPSDEEIALLVEDAISSNKQRYGEILSIKNDDIETKTGVIISLDWNKLELSQRGNDTRLIKMLYKVHYLQWTTSSILNNLLGLSGILLLISLTILGLTVYLRDR